MNFKRHYTVPTTAHSHSPFFQHTQIIHTSYRSCAFAFFLLLCLTNTIFPLVPFWVPCTCVAFGEKRGMFIQVRPESMKYLHAESPNVRVSFKLNHKFDTHTRDVDIEEVGGGCVNRTMCAIGRWEKTAEAEKNENWLKTVVGTTSKSTFFTALRFKLIIEQIF